MRVRGLERGEWFVMHVICNWKLGSRTVDVPIP